MAALSAKQSLSGKPSGKPALSSVKGGGEGDGKPQGNLSSVPKNSGGEGRGKEAMGNPRGGLKGLPGGGQGDGKPQGNLSSVPGADQAAGASPVGSALKAAKAANNIRRGNLMQGARQAAEVAIKEAAQKAAIALAANPVTWIVLLILLLLMFFFWLLLGGDSAAKPCSAPATVGNQTATGEKSTQEYMDIYGHNPAEVEANLVPIDFQGKSVKVHKKVQAVFEKVNNEITAANTGYAFRRVGTYNWRNKNGGTGLSTHSFGITIDINDDTNPYTTADTHDIPPQVAQIFKANGFAWGGDWQPRHDWMHFQYEGDPGVGAATSGQVASNSAGAGYIATAGQVGNGANSAGATSSGCPPSGSGGAPAGGYLPPTDDNCGGKWKLTSSLGKNFGDPQCNFDKNQLYLGLQLADPVNADVWFNKVVPCESGFNPDAYAGPATGTPDAAGAWGLFQMGSATPPGSPPPATGKNGPNDRGDINWQIQMTNATAYGQKIGDLKKYWACARK